jgi:NitT/TauT family transport system substrate-binding protein
MDGRHTEDWSRRKFLGGVTAAGAAALFGLATEPAAAEPPPETTTLRLIKTAGICVAPQYVAEELLRGEGFTNVEYVRTQAGIDQAKVLASGRADITVNFVAPSVVRMDAGDPIVLLAGVHAGCFELFGTPRVRKITDLRGKVVGVQALGQNLFLASMAAYVGLDPQRDIKWLTPSSAEGMRLLAEGKIDAYLGFPPEPQELRARKIGHVVVSSAVDRPWSQYFCCFAAGNREFVRRHPVAAKRALRAILKATDICAREPRRAARSVVERGYVTNFDYALQTMRDVPYTRWRSYDPEDTVRFYALLLREAGLIKSSPQKIIAQGTNWRFLNELKIELRA